ncbi:MAG: DUF459 domain-containing protein [Pseudanabaenaceae cyanobacterium]
MASKQAILNILGLGAVPLTIASLNQFLPVPQPSLAVPSPPLVLDHRHTYLIVGDSLIEGGIGPELENRLRLNNVRLVTRKGKQSTGLLHPERLDWYRELDTIFSEQNYDVVIIMFGLNDLTDITDAAGNKYFLGSPAWQIVYAQKVEQMVQIVFQQGKAKKLIWLGAPIVPDDYKYPYINNTNVQMINNLYRQVLRRYANTIFIDTYPVYSADGKWTQFIKDSQGNLLRVRTQDGIHITDVGGKIMTDIIIRVMRAHRIRLL